MENNEQESDFEPTGGKIQTGQVFRLLTFIDTKPLISRTSLKQLFANEYPNEHLFTSVLEHSIKRGFILEIGDDCLRSSQAGRDWLGKNNDEGLDLDSEDSSSDTGPTRPYEVKKLKMEPKVLSIFQALRKIDKAEIDLDPEFQRAFVWDETRQSRLIESVLIRIPLPAFYLDATDQVRWAVVDGLQRLTTLHRFCNQKDFRLSELQFLHELQGLNFDELPKSYQVLLEDDTTLQFYNLMPGTPLEAKYTIFSRVNTGGMTLTPQEIRHALTQGKVTKWLASTARGESFTKATGGAVESKRMSDRELALRALAFMAFGVSAYKEFSEFDGFLIFAMNEFNTFSDDALENLRKDFNQSLDRVHAIFGRYAFRKFYEKNGRRSPLNRALFEVWVNCLSKFPDLDPQEHQKSIEESFLKLMNNDYDFVRSISSSTGSTSAVQERFTKIETLLGSLK